jgi:O-succinylhomoserine sulfhydrylase
METCEVSTKVITMNNHFETDAIRLQTERSQFSEHSTPLYLTSSFVFEDAEETNIQL